MTDPQDEGISLDRVIKASKLTPSQAVAVGSAILAELAALHGTGSSHGSIETRKVLIYGDGHMALGPGTSAEAGKFSNSEFRQDVRAAGAVICAAFGVEPVPREHASLSKAEREAPAAVVTARAMAQGAMGSDVNRARVAFRDTAGPLAGPEQLAASIRDLAGIAAGIGAKPMQMAPTAPIEPAPPIAAPTAPIEPAPVEPAAEEPAPANPVPPKPAPVEPVRAEPAPPSPAPVEPPARYAEPVWMRPVQRQAAAAGSEPAPRPEPAPRIEPSARTRPQLEEPLPPSYDGAGPPLWRRPIVIAAAVLVILAIPAGFILMGGRASSDKGNTGTTVNVPAAPSSAGTKPSPVASPSTKPPTPSPSLPPTTSAKVTAVELRPNEPCATGTTCSIEVTVKFPNSNPAQDYVWAFKLVDKCTGKQTDAAGGKVTSQAGWIYVQADSRVPLPATNNPLLVYAVTTAPDAVSSQPLTVGSGGC